MSAAGHSNGFAGAMIQAPLAKVQPVEASRAFEPGSIEEAVRLAGLLVKSNLLPDGVRTPEAAFAIIATGREMGLTAMQSLRSIHIIKGKPTLSADLVAALVKSRTDVCDYFMLTASTDTVATYETKRKGEPKPTTMSFTIEDAKRAGLAGGDNWRKYPAAMLRARCITALARAVFPDLAMGIYDPDEIPQEPAAPPQPYVVVEPGVTAPTPSPSRMFEELCERIDAAQSGAELNNIARDSIRAHTAGSIDDAQRMTLAKACKAKGAIIGAAPKAPASEPKVTEGREPGEEG